MTEREPLRLRERRPEDLPVLWRWLHGTPDAEWLRWDGPYFERAGDPPALEAFVEQAATRPPSADRRVIEIGGEPSGTVSRSWEAPPAGGWMELGIVIFDPARWGRGYGTQALREWTELCFRETAAHVLTLTTWSGNERMTRSAARVGYREAARVREARLWQGRRYDSVKLDLLRREWESAGADEPRRPS